MMLAIEAIAGRATKTVVKIIGKSNLFWDKRTGRRPMEPTHIKAFHDDLRAAVLAEVPIGLAKQKQVPDRAPVIKQLTLDQVNRFEQDAMKSLVHQSQTPPSGSTELTGGTEHANLQHQAGLRTYEQTDSMLPVLESLSAHQSTDRKISTTLRWTFTYLTILIAIAAAGMLMFAISVVPNIEALRSQSFLPQPELDPQRVVVFPWLLVVAYAWIGLLLVLLVWLLTGGFYRTSMFLGGLEMKRAKIASVALQTCQHLVQRGDKLETAIDTSCNLIAATSEERRRVHKLASNAQTPEELGRTARLLEVESNRRLVDFKNRIPMRLTVLVGGVLTAMYCILLFWPITGLLQDLFVTGYGK